MCKVDDRPRGTVQGHDIHGVVVVAVPNRFLLVVTILVFNAEVGAQVLDVVVLPRCQDHAVRLGHLLHGIGRCLVVVLAILEDDLLVEVLRERL